MEGSAQIVPTGPGGAVRRALRIVAHVAAGADTKDLQHYAGVNPDTLHDALIEAASAQSRPTGPSACRLVVMIHGAIGAKDENFQRPVLIGSDTDLGAGRPGSSHVDHATAPRAGIVGLRLPIVFGVATAADGEDFKPPIRIAPQSGVGSRRRVAPKIMPAAPVGTVGRSLIVLA